jgi:cation:H+ antiporter
VVALAVTVVLVADDFLSRSDAALLVGIWLAGTWATYRLLGRSPEDDVDSAELDQPVEGTSRRALLVRTMAGLVAVGAGATLAVVGAIEIAEELGASEFLIGFFALSIGTSLPELMLDLTAARRGESALAVGDIVGSSFVDTTLSIGIGPLFFPVAVSASEVVPAVIAAAVAIAAVTIMLIRVDRHERATGAFALALYALFYVVLLRPVP